MQRENSPKTENQAQWPQQLWQQNYWPDVHDTYVVSGSPAAVLEALKQHVEKRKLLRWGAPHRAFQGEVGARAFQLVRIIDYRNSFLPVITGTVEETLEGALITGAPLDLPNDWEQPGQRWAAPSSQA